jgi:hypothetical protein
MINNNIEKPNRDKINLSELYEVQDWSKKFCINTKDIRRAITEVWNNGRAFEIYVKNRKLMEI